MWPLPALEVQSLIHWTTRKVPVVLFVLGVASKKSWPGNCKLIVLNWTAVENCCDSFLGLHNWGIKFPFVTTIIPTVNTMFEQTECWALLPIVSVWCRAQLDAYEETKKLCICQICQNFVSWVSESHQGAKRVYLNSATMMLKCDQFNSVIPIHAT